MPYSLSVASMRGYLSKSISSFNENKLRGLLAEVELRKYLAEVGYGDRISAGGWIARREGPGNFGHNTVVFFAEVMSPGSSYAPGRKFPDPPHGLHTICSTFHQSGIFAYYCAPTVQAAEDPFSVKWSAIQLGLPAAQSYEPFPDSIPHFRSRDRRYNFLRYSTETSAIPADAVPEEFSKENLRISFQSKYLSEIADVDGIFWGQQYTYPLEIKEKTPGSDRGVGDYFGLDVGPFVKLAFYAAKRGNLHSLFIVREIDSVERRQLVKWWFITFDQLAQYASWVFRGGGRTMTGSASAVVRIPKSEFTSLDATSLSKL